MSWRRLVLLEAPMACASVAACRGPVAPAQLLSSAATGHCSQSCLEWRWAGRCLALPSRFNRQLGSLAVPPSDAAEPPAAPEPAVVKPRRRAPSVPLAPVDGDAHALRTDAPAKARRRPRTSTSPADADSTGVGPGGQCWHHGCKRKAAFGAPGGVLAACLLHLSPGMVKAPPPPDCGGPWHFAIAPGGLWGPAPPPACVVIGIDPDLGGAAACLRLGPGPSGMLHVADMPTMTVAITRLARPRPPPGAEGLLTPAPRGTFATITTNRRRPDVPAMVATARRLASNEHGVPPAPPAVFVESVRAGGHGALASSQSGICFGLWTGVFAAMDCPMAATPAASWKRQLGLCGAAKDDSRALAASLFPCAAGALSRKRDHGRAEAILIAVHAAGLRLTPAQRLGAVPRGSLCRDEGDDDE